MGSGQNPAWCVIADLITAFSQVQQISLLLIMLQLHHNQTYSEQFGNALGV
jgi:hypothetical protein